MIGPTFTQEILILIRPFQSNSSKRRSSIIGKCLYAKCTKLGVATYLPHCGLIFACAHHASFPRSFRHENECSLSSPLAFFCHPNVSTFLRSFGEHSEESILVILVLRTNRRLERSDSSHYSIGFLGIPLQRHCSSKLSVYIIHTFSAHNSLL